MWGGFLSAKLMNKINALFSRLKRFDYTTCNITVSDLIDTSGRDLFRKLCSSEHSRSDCYRQRESIVTCEIVVIPMNSRSIVLTCIKSLLSFNRICTFNFFIFDICELSFNRDFAHCWCALDMSNKYYLLTYVQSRAAVFKKFHTSFPYLLCEKKLQIEL